MNDTGPSVSTSSIATVSTGVITTPPTTTNNDDDDEYVISSHATTDRNRRHHDDVHDDHRYRIESNNQYQYRNNNHNHNNTHNVSIHTIDTTNHDTRRTIDDDIHDDDDDDDDDEYAPLTPRDNNTSNDTNHHYQHHHHDSNPSIGSSSSSNSTATTIPKQQQLASSTTTTITTTAGAQYPPRTSNGSTSTSTSSETTSSNGTTKTTTGSSSSTSTSTSSTSSQQQLLSLHPYSFDDTGRASTYLQFFKKKQTPTGPSSSTATSSSVSFTSSQPPATTTIGSSSSSTINHTNHYNHKKQHHFPLDRMYTTNNMTRTPQPPPPPPSVSVSVSVATKQPFSVSSAAAVIVENVDENKSRSETVSNKPKENIPPTTTRQQHTTKNSMSSYSMSPSTTTSSIVSLSSSSSFRSSALQKTTNIPIPTVLTATTTKMIPDKAEQEPRHDDSQQVVGEYVNSTRRRSSESDSKTTTSSTKSVLFGESILLRRSGGSRGQPPPTAVQAVVATTAIPETTAQTTILSSSSSNRRPTRNSKTIPTGVVSLSSKKKTTTTTTNDTTTTVTQRPDVTTLHTANDNDFVDVELQHINHNDEHHDDGDDDDDEYSAWNDLPVTVTTNGNAKVDKYRIRSTLDNNSDGHGFYGDGGTQPPQQPWIVELWSLVMAMFRQMLSHVQQVHQQYIKRVRHSQQNQYDLQSLQQQHKKKCRQMKHPVWSINNEYDAHGPDGTMKMASKKDDIDDADETYDFVLILQPQAVYGFWSTLLDFRHELLSPPIVQYMEEQWRYQMLLPQKSHNTTTNDGDDDDDDNCSMIPMLGYHAAGSYGDGSPQSRTDRSTTTDSPSSDNNSKNNNNGEEDDHDSELHDIFLDDDVDDDEGIDLMSNSKSPHSAIIRRRLPNTGGGRTATPQSATTTPSSLLPKNHQFIRGIQDQYRTPPHLYHPNNHLNRSGGFLSPGLYSYLDKSYTTMTNTATTTAVMMMPPYFSKKSLFERAIESPPPASTMSTTAGTPFTLRSQQQQQQPTHGGSGNATTTPIQLGSLHHTTSLLGHLSSTPASFATASHTHNGAGTVAKTQQQLHPQPPNTTYYPRRFGNPNVPSTATTTGSTALFTKNKLKRIMNPMTMMSPPVRSLLTLSSIVGPSSDVHKQQQSGNKNHRTQQKVVEKPNTEAVQPPKSCENQKIDRHDPNVIDIEDIHNPTIAHGIATRTSRTNGILPFLHALRNGIVVRRHRPGQEAIFCQFMSSDGGDTISLKTLTKEDAIVCFKQQRERLVPLYNSTNITRSDIGNEAQYWSVDESNSECTVPHNFSVPDFVAANVQHKHTPPRGTTADREHPHWTSMIMNKIVHTATQRVGTGRQRAIHISNLVTIHPGRNLDPWSGNSNEIGSSTMRRSQSDCNPPLSFSVVVLSRQLSTSLNATKKEYVYTSTEENVTETQKDSMKIEEYKVQWHGGVGSESNYRYLDFEAASECEYWFIIRGFLLLHRDALVGRYAKSRAAGIGTNTDRINDVFADGSVPSSNERSGNQLHTDEFHEPHTVGWLERTIVDCRKLDKTYMEGFVTKVDAIPPPSDYFLGFRSPGTSIWSRLRQAGLETQRLYSLDPNRVMIKVRCPIDRLLDVAEVLRINVKTRDGSFTPFREDMIEEYDSMIDPLEDPPASLMSWHYQDHYLNFQFRSSIRQTIIDFIIGSRIRDSGAELGQTTDLGQKVQARVPLHMPNKLNAIFTSWFYFWRVENWSHGRTGRSLTHADPINTCQGGIENTAKQYQMKKADDDDFPSANEKLPHIVSRLFVGSMYQPLDSIEAYFGEKVAFYFTWLQHTASHLVFLSIAGLILFLCQLWSGTIDHPLRPLFSIVVMIWTFIVLINWKKRANYMAHRWGTMNYKEQETTRPQFKGDYVTDEITGEWIVTYPTWKRWLKYCISFPLTLLFTLGTLVLILWVHANRDLQLAKHFSNDNINGTTGTKIDFEEFALSSIGRRGPIQSVELSKDNLRSPQFWFLAILLPSMLGLFLPLLNFLLMRLSIILNDFENYRTESEYRTYLIIKVFSFRFVCYFATLYYYSIISIGDDTSSEIGQQSIDNGILRVATGVLVYTTVAQWWQSLVHVCFPMLIGRLRMNHRNQRLADELRELEVEEAEIYRSSKIRFDDSLKDRQVRLMNKRLLLDQAQDKVWIEMLLPPHDSFPEYIQAVVQFIFVSCFSVVFPLTPLIVLFNYLVSMRLDAYKLCRGRRRPIAEKTGGIGVWEHVLHVVAVISVLTNCWLMGFTSSQFYWLKEKITIVGLFAVIIVWEHIMLLIKYVMTTSISSLPKTVRDAMKREQYELNKERNTLMQERRQQQQLLLNEEMNDMVTGDNSNSGNDHSVTDGSHRQFSARMLKHRRSRRTSVSSSSSTTTVSTNVQRQTFSPGAPVHPRHRHTSSTPDSGSSSAIQMNPSVSTTTSGTSRRSPESSSYVVNPYLSKP